jgi:hypothetical protein
MRSLHFAGRDTKLKREGCEYWTATNHYEQEFGTVRKFDICPHGSNGLTLEVKTDLVSPITRTIGGYCVGRWIFTDGKPEIVAESVIYPDRPVASYDKYVCFPPDAYWAYRLNSDMADTPILPPQSGQTWFEVHRGSDSGAVFSNESSRFAVGFDPTVIEVGIYRSRSMSEIKPKWPLSDLEKPMRMIYSC